MRITFVFEDGIMDKTENKEAFKLMLDKAIKNVDKLFPNDWEHMDKDPKWRSQFIAKTDSNHGWVGDHWVIDKDKLSSLSAKKRGQTYVPEDLYLAYFRWCFKLWIIRGEIFDIVF